MKDLPITLREIIKHTILNLFVDGGVDRAEHETDMCILKIKQKLAHLRRVMYQELQTKSLLQPYENLPGSETMSIQKALSTDEILDIVYNELDHCIEGLDQEKKDLVEMSRKE